MHDLAAQLLDQASQSTRKQLDSTSDWQA